MKRLFCALVFVVLAAFTAPAVLAKLDIISRSAWGADEELTFAAAEEQKNEETKEQDKTHDAEKNISETDKEAPEEIARVSTHDEAGREFRWPLQYAKKIKFIVIHYTGLPSELPDDPVQEMRNIYRSHAVSRGWGDIGYHFVIDRQGRIYEGRKGGEFVIGGHALPVNKVSVGISLMGNFNEEDVPPKMLESTVALLRELTRQYKIKPLGKTKYKGKIYSNIHGHQENSAKQDPGLYFNEKFPFVRKLVSYLRKKEPVLETARFDFQKLDKGKLILALPEEKTAFTIRLQNKGKASWNKNTFLENEGDPLLPKVFAKLDPVQKRVPAGALGIFRATLPSGLPGGMRMPELTLVANGSVRVSKKIPLPIVAAHVEKPLRVALGFKEKKPILKSGSGMKVFSGKKLVAEFAPNETATVSRLKRGGYRIKSAGRKFEVSAPPRFSAKNKGILEITNFENRPTWNASLNDNLFRGVLEIRSINKKLKIINELPLEDYLKGVAEISNSDPKEKIKTIIIMARSYAQYYRDIGKKFHGKPYHLDDDPDHTQKYIGAGLELRSPNIVAAINETAGRVVTYNGKLVLAPYFNQSDGKTLSAKEAWKRDDLPYLQSVLDTFCGRTVRKGHGVGLSGCGATELAKQGRTAEQIIKYYLTGVEISVKK